MQTPQGSFPLPSKVGHCVPRRRLRRPGHWVSLEVALSLSSFIFLGSPQGDRTSHVLICQIILMFAPGIHFFSLSSFLSFAISLPYPLRLRQLISRASLSTLSRRYQLHFFHSCIPAVLSSPCNQGDHSPAQNPPTAPHSSQHTGLAGPKICHSCFHPKTFAVAVRPSHFLTSSFHLVSVQMSPPWRGLSWLLYVKIPRLFLHHSLFLHLARGVLHFSMTGSYILNSSIHWMND